MLEKELPAVDDERVSYIHWDDNEEDYGLDDIFNIENDEAFQLIEEKALIDPEDDDFLNGRLDY